MPKRVDRKQSQVVTLLRQLGCSVAVTSDLGQGFPDILVGAAGVSVPVEIKDGTLAPSRRKLTELEQKWHDEWQGSVWVVENDQDCEGLIRWILRRGHDRQQN